jgi:two-component system, response regulator RegA
VKRPDEQPNPPPRKPTVLIVDDDQHLRGYLQRCLAALDYDVRGVGTFEEAVQAAAQQPPDHALLDVRLPGGNGLQLIQPFRNLNPKMRIVLFTAYPSIASTVEAVRLGADDYLPKPASPEQIRTAFARKDRPGHDPIAEAQTPTLARARWEYINFVLRDCDWNIAAAARRLGIHRQSLQRMLKKHPPAK